MAFRYMLKSKIHRAIVTDANLDYEGSVTIDSALMQAADILPYEKIQIANISNGARLETYAIPGPLNSGTICMNGAAAHQSSKGDAIIILSYRSVEDKEAQNLTPKIIYVDERNNISHIENQIETIDLC